MRPADWARVTRFAAGEGTPAERDATARWIAADPARAAAAADAATVWAEAGPPLRDAFQASTSTPTTGRAWGALRARIARDATGDPGGESSSSARRLRLVGSRTPGRPRGVVSPAWAVRRRAAAVLVAGLVGASTAGPLWRRLRGDRPDATYATAPGQRATVLLADGTRVELGMASTLRVRRPGADDGPRDVELAGDAVFTVAHDARRPFRVRAGGAVAEDLGTTFGVRAYADEPGVRVVVVAGVVALRPARGRGGGSTPGAVLRARDVGVVDAAGTTVTTRVPDAAALLGWTAGRFAVRDARLDAVARELGRWFATPVRVADSTAAARRLTLDLPARSLAEVLDAVAVLADVRVRRTAEGVELGVAPRFARPRAAAPPSP